VLGTRAPLILSSILFTIRGTCSVERVFFAWASRILPSESVAIQTVWMQGELGTGAPWVFPRIEVTFGRTVFMEWIFFTRTSGVLPGEFLTIGGTIRMGWEL